MAQRVTDIGIGSNIVQNDFDGLPIYKEIKQVTDDFGNVFMRIPKFYIKKTSTAGKLSIQISKEQIAGSYLPRCFRDFVNNRELPHVDIGKYLASISTDGTKLESKSAKTPLVSRSIVNFRTLAKANGTGYQQMDIHVLDVLQSLFYVEFATLNSQSVHPGFTSGTSGLAPTGGTNTVVASSGAMGTGGTFQFKYRGIEDLWGHAHQWVDGVNITDRQAWVCENANSYQSDTFASPYKKLSYVNSAIDSYIVYMGFDVSNPYAQFPTSGGGTTSTYYSDYYYQNAGQRVARFGGNWDIGGASGISLWDMSAASATTALTTGGRLVKKATS